MSVRVPADAETAELGPTHEVRREEVEKPRPRSSLGRVQSVAWTVLRFALALFLFVGALQLMKTGAASLDVLEPGGFLVANAVSTLGLGWLGALLVLSGSPIAASALTLVAAGEEATAGAEHFTEIQGFTMLTGSRLGAAFVVLVTAVVYALRGGVGRRKAPVSTAVIALCTTALIYIPAALIGLALLNWGSFHALELRFPSRFIDLIDLLYGPLVARAEDAHPALVFLGGLGVLLVSFKLIDTVLPTLDETRIGSQRLEWLRRKWPMFGLGSLVALVTMSVSVALTILIPLVAKKYVNRDYIIPYIMGANITTLGDTMLAAFALGSPAAVRIVLAEVIATSALSVILLTFFFPQIRSGMWRFHNHFVKSPLRLALFTAALFLVPLTTIGIAGAIG
jgi:sodium-dependent phosphate cotransporter